MARAALEQSSAAIVFRGEAGIGKTTLWDAAVRAAVSADRRVLVARPVEAERRLGLAAFADLLEPVVGEVLPELPRPQRRALQAALLLAEGEGGPPDPRTLGAALLGSLRVLGDGLGAVLAVDDFQWVDRASGAALGFALRRLSSVHASAVLAVRAGVELPVFDHELAVSVVDVGPLSLGALHRLVSDRLGEAFPRSLLRRVHAACGGNPLYALEIARALQRAGPVEAGDALPLPAGLEALLCERIGALAPRARRALAAAGALSEPRLEWIEREGDLQPALDAGLARVELGIVRFSHPLFASAAYSLLAPRRRRDLHRRLAMVVEDVEERAVQLALSHPGPEESAAAALEAAAARALARGAPVAAGELLELAALRTEHPGRRPAIRLAAARAYYAAGDAGAARRLAEQALPEFTPGPARAGALSLLSILTRGDLAAAITLAEQAWSEAEGDAAAEALAARLLARWCGLGGDLTRAQAFARRALERVDAIPDQLRIAVIANAAIIDIWATGRTDTRLLAEAVAIEERSGPPDDAGSARLAFATALFVDGRYAEARRLLEQLIASLEAAGDEYMLQEALNHLAWVEMLAGRPALAAALAARGAEIREQSGMPHGRALLAFFAAQPAVYLGRVEEARALAEAGLAAGVEAGDIGATLQNAAALGFLELSLGNPAAAVDALAPAAELIKTRVPGSHPAHAPVLPNLIESLIVLGRLEEARTHLELLEERGRSLDSAWALAQAARANGEIAAAEGDLPRAFARFKQALREHERMEGPFERGRTLLAQGAVLRRARQWRAARESLTAALAIFDQTEAPLWAGKARAELARIGGRPVRGGLTPTEERVATLAAAGRSNKEIANELFVTVRTVETHLTSVYAKLGVHSRSKLASVISS